MTRDTLTLIREITLNALMKFGVEWESRSYEEFDIGPDWTRLNGGYARCLTSNDFYSTLEIVMPPNATFDLHLHPDAEEEFYVMEGHVEITVLKKTINVKAGDVFKVKAGLLHKAYYPYGMRGIITLRKVSKSDNESKKVEIIQTLLKIKGGETEVPPPSTTELTD